MERRALREQHGSARTEFGREYNRAVDRSLSAGDHYLPGRIVVGGGANFALCGRLGERLRLLEIGTEQRRHCPFSYWHCFLHGAAADLQESRRIWKAERTGCGQRRIFAQ